MGKTRWSVGLTLTALSALTVAGCGAPATVRSESATPSSTPTAACPSAGTEPMPDKNCAFYDGDAAMAANETYRQRRSLSPDMKTLLEEYVEPAREALTSLGTQANPEKVSQALESVGLNKSEIQTDDTGSGVRFGAAAPSGGCVYGYVSLDGGVDIAPGGSIMDGGCLDMIGH